MPRILLVKTSSLGDVVHNLPVVCDILRCVPGAMVDWVVAEAFAAVPRMHFAVSDTIVVALRRWRRTPWNAALRAEVSAFAARLRAGAYDAIIDTQGLLKSALIARAARGSRHGLDWTSSREPLALLYDRTYRVPWSAHAVERNRSLAAQALGYTVPAEMVFGIRPQARALPWLPNPRFVVLLHATSADAKLWAETCWIALARMFCDAGTVAVLPWGSPEEQARSERISAAVTGSIVPPRLTLEELSTLLAQSEAVVGVDTGLTHLAGALGARTAGVYVATDPAATGIHGCARAANIGGVGAAPSASAVYSLLETLRTR